MTFLIRPAARADAAEISVIYNYYAQHTTVTFQEAPLGAEFFAEKIAAATGDNPFLAAVEEQGVRGYAYADEWKSRCAYRGVVESSVYVAVDQERRGIGRALMAELLARLRQNHMRAVIAVIALPNPSSIRLHERLGFSPCGVLPGVGVKFNEERSVGFWLKKLANADCR